MTKEVEELAEARKYIQDLHDRGKYSNLDVLLVNYAKHSKLKMLRAETDEKISKELKELGVDADNMIGSSYKLGILYHRDKLIKRIEDG